MILVTNGNTSIIGNDTILECKYCLVGGTQPTHLYTPKRTATRRNERGCECGQCCRKVKGGGVGDSKVEGFKKRRDRRGKIIARNGEIIIFSVLVISMLTINVIIILLNIVVSML